MITERVSSRTFVRMKGKRQSDTEDSYLGVTCACGTQYQDRAGTSKYHVSFPFSKQMGQLRVCGEG